MKRVVSKFLLFLVLFGQIGCNDVSIIKQYQVDSVFSYSSYEGDKNKTEVSYSLDITGSKEDVANISKSELIVNREYEKLVLSNSKQMVTVIAGQDDKTCLRVEGSIVFNTANMNKEEIIELKLFDGLEIKDKDNRIHNYDLDELNI